MYVLYLFPISFLNVQLTAQLSQIYAVSIDSVDRHGVVHFHIKIFGITPLVRKHFIYSSLLQGFRLYYHFVGFYVQISEFKEFETQILELKDFKSTGFIFVLQIHSNMKPVLLKSFNSRICVSNSLNFEILCCRYIQISQFNQY